MAADEAKSEPTMEEILASIRRIISEDDAPAPQPEKRAPVLELAPEPPPAMAEVFSHKPEPLYSEAPEDEFDDVIAFDPEPPEPLPPPPPPPVAKVEPVRPAPIFVAPAPEPAGLVGADAVSASAGALAKLVGSMPITTSVNSVEGLVRELLRPMMKEWLDANLPRIVEAKVEEELQRIRRQLG
jgi:cell pole-organizing protein PopZ